MIDHPLRISMIFVDIYALIGKRSEVVEDFDDWVVVFAVLRVLRWLYFWQTLIYLALQISEIEPKRYALLLELSNNFLIIAVVYVFKRSNVIFEVVDQNTRSMGFNIFPDHSMVHRICLLVIDLFCLKLRIKSTSRL